MAEKKLLTRIIMNHGEWASYAGKKAKDGEVIYVKVGTTQANGKVSEPIWMQKIGDGVTEVQNLPWVVAPAADVYEWAKKAKFDWEDVDPIPGAKLGLTVTVTGNGNAITDASWNESAKTLTLTKGETFATKKEFDEHNHDSLYKKIQTAVPVKGAADKTLKVSQNAQGVITTEEVAIQIAQSQVTGLGTSLDAKADKVTGATAGNFAGLDADGNLTDSGKKATDFAEAGHKHDDDYSKLGHTHTITADDDDVIIAQGGELSVTVSHKKELGENKSYTTAATTAEQKPTFGEAATVVIPQLKVNEYGHVTEAKDQTVEIYIPGLNEVAESSHTHTDGKGTKVTGDGAKAIDLNVEFKADLVAKNDKKYLQLVDATSKEVIAEFDTTEFIKDGMIETVEISEDGLDLVITWNADSDKGDKTVTTIPLTGLVDVYTGDATDTITVTVSDDNVITAEVNPTSITNDHIATDAAIAKTKLASDVQASLDKADTAVQSVSLESGSKNGTLKLTVDGKPTDDIAVKGLGTAAFVDADDYVSKNDLENQVITSELEVSTTGGTVTIDNEGFSIMDYSGKSPIFNLHTEPAGGEDLAIDGTDQAKTAFNEFLNTKTKQTVVSDPTANGKALAFIDTISQNENGEITVTKKNVNLDDYALSNHNHDDKYVKLGDPITIGTEDNGTVLGNGGVSFNDDMGSASLGTDGISIDTNNTHFKIKVSAGELQEASMSEDIALGLNQSLKAVTKAGTGLKVTETGSEGAKEYQMDIDDTIVFILDGGNASNLD